MECCPIFVWGVILCSRSVVHRP